MLQYDFTRTTLLHSSAVNAFPNEAEMFAVTAALLLLNDAPYSDLVDQELRITAEGIEALAQCIEYRLSPFTFEFGDPETLRARLREFVGLRVSAVLNRPAKRR
jgi:hypothetical protein